MSNIHDYVNAITAAAGGVARHLVGQESKARQGERRLYRWLIVADEFEPTTGRGKDDGGGRQLKTRIATFAVRMSGATFAEVEMLRAALVTATEQTMGGNTDRNYRLGRALWFARADNADQFEVQQLLSLVVPFRAVDLPSGDPPQAAPDGSYTTTLITARAISGAAFEEPTP